MLEESLLCAVGVALSIPMHTVGAPRHWEQDQNSRKPFCQVLISTRWKQGAKWPRESRDAGEPLCCGPHLTAPHRCTAHRTGIMIVHCFVKWFGVQVNEGTEISKCSSRKMEHDNYPLQKKVTNNTKNTKAKTEHHQTSTSYFLLSPFLLSMFIRWTGGGTDRYSDAVQLPLYFKWWYLFSFLFQF